MSHVITHITHSDDILKCILDFGDALDLMMLCRTNKQLNDIIQRTTSITITTKGEVRKKKYLQVNFSVELINGDNSYLPIVNAAAKGYLDIVILLRSELYP